MTTQSHADVAAQADRVANSAIVAELHRTKRSVLQICMIWTIPALLLLTLSIAGFAGGGADPARTLLMLAGLIVIPLAPLVLYGVALSRLPTEANQTQIEGTLRAQRRAWHFVALVAIATSLFSVMRVSQQVPQGKRNGTGNSAK